MIPKALAGGQIEWSGRVYNYGDEVPIALSQRHPEWVVYNEPSPHEINAMTEADRQEFIAWRQARRRSKGSQKLDTKVIRGG